MTRRVVACAVLVFLHGVQSRKHNEKNDKYNQSDKVGDLRTIHGVAGMYV